jgi:hypothetical protein
MTDEKVLIRPVIGSWTNFTEQQRSRDKRANGRVNIQLAACRLDIEHDKPVAGGRDFTQLASSEADSSP